MKAETPLVRALGLLTFLGLVGAVVAVLLTALIADAGAMSAVALDRPTPATNSGDARYYRSTVATIKPSVPGLALEALSSGLMTLANHTGKTVTVFGYAGEPYLRITPAGVDENVNSVTTALNASPDMVPARTVTPTNPVWRHRSDSLSVIWRDYRTHWASGSRPRIVAADPHHPHQVFNWAMQLTVSNQPILVRGIVRWNGSPRFNRIQIIALVAGVAFLVFVGLFFGRKIRRRRRHRKNSMRFLRPTPPAAPRATPPAAGRPATGRRVRENLFQDRQPDTWPEHTNDV